MEFSKLDLFQWLDLPIREAFTKAARTVIFNPGSLIYAQGDVGDTMFRIRTGLVRMSVIRPEGKQLLYQIFQAGDCFGTSSIVDGGPRPQMTEASTLCELQIISQSDLARLQAEYPNLSQALLKLMTAHMRHLSEYFAGSNLDGMVAWLAQRLFETATRFGHDAEGGRTLDQLFSQSDFADMLGTSRQTVNKAMTELRRLGLIAMRGSKLHIVSMDALSAVAFDGRDHVQLSPGSPLSKS